MAWLILAVWLGGALGDLTWHQWFWVKDASPGAVAYDIAAALLWPLSVPIVIIFALARQLGRFNR